MQFRTAANMGMRRTPSHKAGCSQGLKNQSKAHEDEPFELISIYFIVCQFTEGVLNGITCSEPMNLDIPPLKKDPWKIQI